MDGAPSSGPSGDGLRNRSWSTASVQLPEIAVDVMIALKPDEANNTVAPVPEMIAFSVPPVQSAAPASTAPLPVDAPEIIKELTSPAVLDMIVRAATQQAAAPSAADGQQQRAPEVNEKRTRAVSFSANTKDGDARPSAVKRAGFEGHGRKTREKGKVTFGQSTQVDQSGAVATVNTNTNGSMDASSLYEPENQPEPETRDRLDSLIHEIGMNVYNEDEALALALHMSELEPEMEDAIITKLIENQFAGVVDDNSTLIDGVRNRTSSVMSASLFPVTRRRSSVSSSFHLPTPAFPLLDMDTMFHGGKWKGTETLTNSAETAHDMQYPVLRLSAQGTWDVQWRRQDEVKAAVGDNWRASLQSFISPLLPSSNQLLLEAHSKDDDLWSVATELNTYDGLDGDPLALAQEKVADSEEILKKVASVCPPAHTTVEYVLADPASGRVPIVFKTGEQLAAATTEYLNKAVALVEDDETSESKNCDVFLLPPVPPFLPSRFPSTNATSVVVSNALEMTDTMYFGRSYQHDTLGGYGNVLSLGSDGFVAMPVIHARAAQHVATDARQQMLEYQTFSRGYWQRLLCSLKQVLVDVPLKAVVGHISHVGAPSEWKIGTLTSPTLRKIIGKAVSIARFALKREKRLQRETHMQSMRAEMLAALPIVTAAAAAAQQPGAPQQQQQQQQPSTAAASSLPQQDVSSGANAMGIVSTPSTRPMSSSATPFPLAPANIASSLLKIQQEDTKLRVDNKIVGKLTVAELACLGVAADDLDAVRAFINIKQAVREGKSPDGSHTDLVACLMSFVQQYSTTLKTLEAGGVYQLDPLHVRSALTQAAAALKVTPSYMVTASSQAKPAALSSGVNNVATSTSAAATAARSDPFLNYESYEISGKPRKAGQGTTMPRKSASHGTSGSYARGKSRQVPAQHPLQQQQQPLQQQRHGGGTHSPYPLMPHELLDLVVPAAVAASSGNVGVSRPGGKRGRQEHGNAAEDRPKKTARVSSRGRIINSSAMADTTAAGSSNNGGGGGVDDGDGLGGTTLPMLAHEGNGHHDDSAKAAAAATTTTAAGVPSRGRSGSVDYRKVLGFDSAQPVSAAAAGERGDGKEEYLYQYYDAPSEDADVLPDDSYMLIGGPESSYDAGYAFYSDEHNHPDLPPPASRNRTRSRSRAQSFGLLHEPVVGMGLDVDAGASSSGVGLNVDFSHAALLDAAHPASGARKRSRSSSRDESVAALAMADLANTK